MRTHSCCMGSSVYPQALADPVARRTVLNPWEPRQVFIPSLHAWLCVYVFLYTDSAAVYQIEKEEGEREREKENVKEKEKERERERERGEGRWLCLRACTLMRVHACVCMWVGAI